MTIEELYTDLKVKEYENIDLYIELLVGNEFINIKIKGLSHSEDGIRQYLSCEIVPKHD